MARSKRLAHIGLERSIKSLHDSKRENINKHVTHTYASDESWLICVPDEVRINKLNEHVEHHADDGTRTKFAHDPEL